MLEILFFLQNISVEVVFDCKNKNEELKHSKFLKNSKMFVKIQKNRTLKIQNPQFYSP